MMNTLLRKLKIVVPGIRKKVGNEQGSVLVLFAMSLTVLLGFTALVIDVGTAYLQNVRLSNAVDAAALAGSQALPDSPARAYQLALDYAQKNGVAPEDITIEIADNNREIRVEARKHVAYSFAPVLGISSVDVQQGAGAKVGAVSSVWGAVPFSIQEQELAYGEEYLLKSGSGSNPPGGAQHSGWFGALRLSGNGASSYEQDIKYGYQGWLTIGDVVDIENGNMSGPTTRGVNYRISQCKHTPACSDEHFAADCPRLLKVPVVEPYGKKTVRVKGFAIFFLDRVDGQGNQNNVWGTFVRMSVLGEITDDPAADYGANGYVLSY